MFYVCCVSAAASGKSYKEQKEMERRARAGDSVGWNASFVRSDTVVDALADRLGVGKSDILDREEVRTYIPYHCRVPPPLVFRWGIKRQERRNIEEGGVCDSPYRGWEGRKEGTLSLFS